MSAFFQKHLSATWRQLLRDRRGSMLIFILVFGSAAALIIIEGVASYALFEHRVSLLKHDREMAFHIAEAGINYYRWHLAHAPTDYSDGTGQPGPYIRSYKDKDGNDIGKFSLAIQPPLSGSSVVVVSSTGWLDRRPTVRRTIQVRLGFPALTEYTFLSNANMSFSFTSAVNGQTHANGGIRFDGASDSWVKSAKESYEYQPGQTRNGVWGGGGPKSFWQYPVPAIDFFSVTADMAALKDLAVNNGVYLTSSGQEGWHLVFRGGSFDLYRVTSRDCYNGPGQWRWQRWQGWYWSGTTYCYDIGSETFVRSGQIPANGAIFVEDDVWVEGLVDGRVSVGVGRFPVQQPHKRIYVVGNTNYAQRGGNNVLGLVAQGDIIIPYEVPTALNIDAALLSQFGTIQRPYYYGNTRDSLTVFGSQIYYQPGGMKWVNGWGNVISGFVSTQYTYDGNLRYYPPPGFPVGKTYELISWEEVE